MKENKIQKIDSLTKLFTYDAAQTEINHYIQDGSGHGKDTVLLIQLNWWEDVCRTKGIYVGNLLLAKFSFVLTKVWLCVKSGGEVIKFTSFFI